MCRKVVVFVEKTDYLGKTENIQNDLRRFEKINLENDEFFSFPVNQEKRVDSILKDIIASNGIFEETRRFLNQLKLGKI